MKHHRPALPPLIKILPRPTHTINSIHDESDLHENVFLARMSVSNNVVSVLSSLFIGAPFVPYMTEEIRTSSVNRAVTKAGYRRICIPINIKGNNHRIATRMFVGMHIVKFRRELVLVSQTTPLTFLDVVIVVILSCIDPSKEADAILRGLFPGKDKDTISRLFEKCTTLKSKEEYRRLAPEVTDMLLKHGSLLVLPSQIASLDRHMDLPLFVYVDQDRPLVECTHLGLKRDILTAVCALDCDKTKHHLEYYRHSSSEGFVVGACDRLTLTVITPKTHETIRRIWNAEKKFSETTWKSLVRNIPHHESSSATSSAIYVAIFEVLWGKDDDKITELLEDIDALADLEFLENTRVEYPIGSHITRTSDRKDICDHLINREKFVGFI